MSMPNISFIWNSEVVDVKDTVAGKVAGLGLVKGEDGTWRIAQHRIPYDADAMLAVLALMVASVRLAPRPSDQGPILNCPSASMPPTRIASTFCRCR